MSYFCSKLNLQMREYFFVYKQTGTDNRGRVIRFLEKEKKLQPKVNIILKCTEVY